MSVRAMPAQLASVTLLAAWLGAALLVAAVVAPAAFAVLPSRTLAGALVGRVLPVIFWSGIGVGLVVAALSDIAPASVWRIGSALVLSVSCAAAQLVVVPRIDALGKNVVGPIAMLDPSDPRRQAFGRLHASSVACMGVGALAALVALVLIARTITSRYSS